MNKYIKKILVILALFALTFSFACGADEETNPVSDEEKVVEKLTKIAIGYGEGDSESSVTKDLVLCGDNDGFKITWSSDNQGVIGFDGKVTRTDKDVTVKLTVVVELNDVKLQKSFSVVVKADKTQPSADAVAYSVIKGINIADGETTTETYIVEGVITKITNTEYGNVYISDGKDELLIYGILDSNQVKYSALEYKPIVGDTIKVQGPVKNYKGENELFNAILLNVVKGEAPNPPQPSTDEPEEFSTLADVLNANVEEGATTEVFYKVTGKIISIESPTYGNCHITDGEYTIIVYGMNTKDGVRYDAMTDKPEIGDTVIVYGAIKNYKATGAEKGTNEIVNSILVSFTKGEPVEVKELSIVEILKLSTGTSAIATGTVIGVHSRGFVIDDETGAILVYLNAQPTYAIGDKVKVEGMLTQYHERNQFDSSAKIEKLGTEEVDFGQPKVLTEDDIDKFTGDPGMGTYVEVEGLLIADGTYYNLKVGEADKVISITYPFASLNLSAMVNKNVKLTGIILDLSSDASRLNILVHSVECLEELEGNKLPMNANFILTAKEDKTLPTGWTWTKASKGSYASPFWQSFRDDGNGIQSPVFDATNDITVEFIYYLNNAVTGTSQIEVKGYDANGQVVATEISENLSVGETGVTNSKTISFELKGTGIVYITVTFVKNKGGNIGFSEINIK